MSMIDEVDFNEGMAIMDALTFTGGKKVRQDKIQAINRKQRKYKGIFRVQDGAGAYWMLDSWGNPQLRLEEETIIRLTPDGVRIFMPEFLPQNTVINRIKKVLPEYGWLLDWDANRSLTFVNAGKKQAFIRKHNALTGSTSSWWYVSKATKREFYTEYGTRFENNMLVPYTTVGGTCEWVDWTQRMGYPMSNQPKPCNKKATSVSRWNEVLCDEHKRAA